MSRTSIVFCHRLFLPTANSNAVAETDPANDYFRTIVGKEGDVNWEHLLAPAPIGIAILSQLMICASRITDIRIDQKPGPLMRHPESFCTSLVQIGNDAYTAFSKAHSNMEQIRLEMAQVPTHVRECFNILKSDNEVAVEKFLPRRLVRIQEAAENGLKLSEEVSEAFIQLMALIRQVLEATSASKGVKEQKIESDIKAAIEEAKNLRLVTKQKDKEHLDAEREIAQEAVKKTQDSVNQAQNRERGLWEAFFYPNRKKRSIETARRLSEEAERRLNVTKRQFDQIEIDMKNINEDYISKLETMHIDVNENIDRDQAIQLLGQGLENLGKLQDQWAGMAQYFQSIHNIIKTRTEKKLTDFKEEAAAAAQSTGLIDFMANSILESCQSSYLTHRIADMYVKVSNRFIMKNVAGITKMMALKDGDVDEAQRTLVASCQEASAGILQMVKEEKMEMMQQIKEHNDILKNEIESKLEITEA